MAGLLPPAGGGMYPNVPNEAPGGTGTQTNTPSVDVGQLYQEWAALNPDATPADIFAAGMDAALSGDTPVGTGVEDFTGMPYDPSMQPDAISQVDSFSEISGTDDFTGTGMGLPATGGELGPGFNSPGYVQNDAPQAGIVNQPAGWRGTVIDVSDIQPRQSGGPGG